jgi:aminopeptidase-like protein
MHRLAKELWPICRSLTGDGVRLTLKTLQRELPGLTLHEVPSGTRCFDWEVPNEWNIRDAWVIGPDGEKVVDFKASNLHVVGYSEPVDTELDLTELLPHLFSLPEQPTAIPYITSYYKRFWGFCMTHERLEALKPGKYRVKIDSTLEPGHLTYAELLLPGREPGEILLSTYVCHPSMANNELSGPVVTVALAKWLAGLSDRRFSYRIYFGPETIGSIVYLQRNLAQLKARLEAGYVITCVGDERSYSFLPSRRGDTLADKVTRSVMREMVPGFKEYSFLARGSDERQYCSPGADLPVVSVMRTKYAEYPEYHTSLDDLSFVTPTGLDGAFEVLKGCLEVLESNRTYRTAQPCEPQLGKRGLYPNISTKGTRDQVKDMMNFLAYCTGEEDLVSIANRIEVSPFKLIPIAQRLHEAGVIVECGQHA